MSNSPIPNFSEFFHRIGNGVLLLHHEEQPLYSNPNENNHQSIWQNLQTFLQYHSAIVHYAIAWASWLIVGTIFYATVNFNGNFAHGFYYSVNVGYSVGWSGLTDYNSISKVFSIFYLLVGAIFLTIWLVFLVENAVDDNNLRILSHSQPEVAPLNMNIFVRVQHYLCLNHKKLVVVYVWFIYILVGAAWSCYVLKWPFLDGLYFALSSLSTGGMWSIPIHSQDYVFGCVGLYTCFGVPIMGMAMGNIATLMFQSRQQLDQSRIMFNGNHPSIEHAEDIHVDHFYAVRNESIFVHPSIRLKQLESPRASFHHSHRLKPSYYFNAEEEICDEQRMAVQSAITSKAFRSNNFYFSNSDDNIVFQPIVDVYDLSPPDMV